MARSLALGARLEKFVERQVVKGRYPDADEVLRAGLRSLQDRERADARKLEELDRMLEAAQAELDAGKRIPAEQVFTEIKARIATRAKKRGR